MLIDTSAACKLLIQNEDILILTHQCPDGDTLGSAFALLWALERLGKRARVENPDALPERYRFIYGDYIPADFTPRFVVAVDTANPSLLGALEPVWDGRIDLCIDHHKENTINSRYKLLDSASPAAALLVYNIIKELGTGFDPKIATAVFTGLSTDTGCFLFYNVTAGTHRAAAEMIDCGANHSLVNKLMFDTKSKARMELDKTVLETLEYHFGGRCACITVSEEATESLGITEAELDGISAIPRRIEGVIVGLTFREKPGGAYRVSVRTSGGLDASEICAVFGGGGHKNAGGCTITGTLAHVKEVVLREIEKVLS